MRLIICNKSVCSINWYYKKCKKIIFEKYLIYIIFSKMISDEY